MEFSWQKLQAILLPCFRIRELSRFLLTHPGALKQPWRGSDVHPARLFTVSSSTPVLVGKHTGQSFHYLHNPSLFDYWTVIPVPERAFIPELWPRRTRSRECQTRWLSGEIWLGMNYIVNISIISHRNKGLLQLKAATHNESSSALTHLLNKSNYLSHFLLWLFWHWTVFQEFTNYFLFQALPWNNVRGNWFFKRQAQITVPDSQRIRASSFFSSLLPAFKYIYQTPTYFGFISILCFFSQNPDL